MDFDKKEVDIIKKILHNGDRVEIVPTKDGVRIYSVRRREKKQKSEDEEETDE